jgi:4-amino-4-deoxy-L-arabinose transferase-like glycosyltransferase
MSSAAPLGAIHEAAPRETSAASRPAISARACRGIAALVIGGVLVFHLIYLHWRCPLDLAGDEAYYWDWSRQLDWSYYSKGPATAYLIRASCAIFGDTMPAVRLPAVILRAGVAVLTYWLALRLFKKDSVALIATLLSYAVPMFLAAGLIMTTDPAFLFFWGLATCLGCIAVLDGRRWAWLGVGLAVGLGTLTKFSMPLWLIGLFSFLAISHSHRRYLRTPWPWLAVAIAALCTLPVWIWNAKHNWVTFLHVGEDVGARSGYFRLSNLLDFWAGQLGVIGPLLVVVAAAVVATVFDRSEHEREQRRFLRCFGLPVFLAVFVTSFRANPAGNWAAAAYFTFFILTAHFLAKRFADATSWKRWRWMVYPCAGAGLAVVVIAHQTQMLYPLAKSLGLPALRLDPTERIKGWAEVGQIASDRREIVGEDALVFAPDYQIASELAFYMRGHPKTFVAGSYFTGPEREPFSQFDVWSDRRLDHPSLLKCRALYVGAMNDDLRKAFSRIEPLSPIEVLRGGLVLRRFQCWACYDFTGMQWPGWNGKYNKTSSHVLLLPRAGESDHHLVRRTGPFDRDRFGLKPLPQ